MCVCVCVCVWRDDVGVTVVTLVPLDTAELEKVQFSRWVESVGVAVLFTSQKTCLMQMACQ